MVNDIVQWIDNTIGKIFGLIGLLFVALFVFGLTMLLITIIGIAYGVIKGLFI